MSNLAIDININAPELVGAIEHLCVALGKPVSLVASTAAKQEPAPQPVQTAPVTPAPAQPAAPQAPVQAAPVAAPTVKTYTVDEIAKAPGCFIARKSVV